MLSEPREERERGERGGGGRRGRVEAIVRLTSHLKTMTVLNDHSISHTEGRLQLANILAAPLVVSSTTLTLHTFFLKLQPRE